MSMNSLILSRNSAVMASIFTLIFLLVFTSLNMGTAITKQIKAYKEVSTGYYVITASLFDELEERLKRTPGVIEFHEMITSSIGVDQRIMDEISRRQGITPKEATEDWLTGNKEYSVWVGAFNYSDFPIGALPTLIEGRFPQGPGECAVFQPLLGALSKDLGDKMTLNFSDYVQANKFLRYECTVVGSYTLGGVVQDQWILLYWDDLKNILSERENSLKKIEFFKEFLDELPFLTTPKEYLIKVNTSRPGVLKDVIEVISENEDKFREVLRKMASEGKATYFNMRKIDPSSYIHSLTLNTRYVEEQYKRVKGAVERVSTASLAIAFVGLLFIPYAAWRRDSKWLALRTSLGSSWFSLIIKYVTAVFLISLMSWALGAALTFSVGEEVTKLFIRAPVTVWARDWKAILNVALITLPLTLMPLLTSFLLALRGGRKALSDLLL